MEIRQLKGTDLQSSRLVLGTMTFGASVDEATASAMVDVAIDAGVNHFDTANAYNGGVTEEMLGRIIAGRRDNLVIATKVGGRMGSDPDQVGLSRRAIHRAIDESLRRLNLDHVDLYYLHLPDPSVPIAESIGALEELVQAGKIRFGATSNYAAWQMAEMRTIAERYGSMPLGVSQPLYNLLARRLDDEYAAFSSHFGFSNIVYNPLAGGLLTGRHRDDADPTEGSRFASTSLGAMYRDRYWNEAQFRAVRDLQQVATDAGMSLIELSFRWLLWSPLVEAILLGASSLEQLQQNLAAATPVGLTGDVLKACDDIWSTLAGAAPKYSR